MVANAPPREESEGSYLQQSVTRATLLSTVLGVLVLWGAVAGWGSRQEADLKNHIALPAHAGTAPQLAAMAERLARVETTTANTDRSMDELRTDFRELLRLMRAR